ncbi:unnamed protein product, partial [Brenthis ino]
MVKSVSKLQQIMVQLKSVVTLTFCDNLTQRRQESLRYRASRQIFANWRQAARRRHSPLFDTDDGFLKAIKIRFGRIQGNGFDIS